MAPLVRPGWLAVTNPADRRHGLAARPGCRRRRCRSGPEPAELLRRWRLSGNHIMKVPERQNARSGAARAVTLAIRSAPISTVRCCPGQRLNHPGRGRGFRFPVSDLSGQAARSPLRGIVEFVPVGAPITKTSRSPGGRAASPAYRKAHEPNRWALSTPRPAPDAAERAQQQLRQRRVRRLHQPEVAQAPGADDSSLLRAGNLPLDRRSRRPGARRQPCQRPLVLGP